MVLELDRKKRILNTYEAMCNIIGINFRDFGFVAPVVFLLSEEYGIQFYNVYEAWDNGLTMEDIIYAVRNLIKKLDACAVIFVQEVRLVEEGVEKRQVVARVEFCGDDGTVSGVETIFELDTEHREVRSVNRAEISDFMFFGVSEKVDLRGGLN
jgi:hypothetical protein